MGEGHRLGIFKNRVLRRIMELRRTNLQEAG
jgi:hypothetical protein